MQLPQWLARFNRYVTNPVQRIWAGWAPTMGILEHTGLGRLVFARLPFENAVLLRKG